MEAGTRGFPRLGGAFGHEKWGKSGEKVGIFYKVVPHSWLRWFITPITMVYCTYIYS
jgi:hypothetical protein